MSKAVSKAIMGHPVIISDAIPDGHIALMDARRFTSRLKRRVIDGVDFKFNRTEDERRIVLIAIRFER